MARKFIDCREYPSEMNCTVAISADTDDELIEVATQHAIAVHKHTDSPELRKTLHSLVKEGAPA
jgi:predicted small metal-binding protein